MSANDNEVILNEIRRINKINLDDVNEKNPNWGRILWKVFKWLLWFCLIVIIIYLIIYLLPIFMLWSVLGNTKLDVNMSSGNTMAEN